MHEQRTVTRIYRAAIRVGEDYITLEETITLPLGASDDEVRQAVELGWRVYQAQREAVERQVEETRLGRVASNPPQQSGAGGASFQMRDPDAPASDKQRSYIARLQDNLGWSNEELAAYAAEQGVDLVALTKGQASGFIDGLKQLADAPRALPRATTGEPSMLRAIAGGVAEPPPPEPNGDEGTDIPF